MPTLLEGEVLAGYRVEGVLGQGGMGVVYRATQLALERVVALKVLPDELRLDPSFQARFRREGTVQAALDHPNIVTVYEAGECEHGLYLAMRLIRGPNLKEMIATDHLAPARTLHVLRQVGDAIDAAHAVGLVHRDVKPQNVLVDVSRGDHAYLADFGITKETRGPGMTRTGELVGTLDYVSPEQIGGAPAGDASDIYALAATLYESLTGSVPYPRDTDAAVIYAHMSDPPPSVTSANRGLPSALDEVIARGMAKKPADRYANALELIDDAEAALGTGTASSRAQPTVIDVQGATRVEEPAAQDAVTEPVSLATAEIAPRPAADTRPEPRRGLLSHRRGLLIASVGIVIVLAVAGFLLGRGSADSAHSPPSQPSSASAGGVTVPIPVGWTRLASPPVVEGLVFARSIALSPRPGGKPSVVAGELERSPAAALLRNEQIVRLGNIEAYRFRGRPELFVVPQTGGDAAVACVDPASVATCRRVAAALQVTPRPRNELAARANLATQMGRVVDSLNTSTGKSSRQLNAARTASAQRTASTDLARVYESAASRIEAMTFPADLRKDKVEVTNALADVAQRFRALATAARSTDTAAWAKARSRALRAQSLAAGSVSRTLASLRSPML